MAESTKKDAASFYNNKEELVIHKSFRNIAPKKKNKSFEGDELQIISEPVRVQHTIGVKFNETLSKYEGLPTEWRELLRWNLK